MNDILHVGYPKTASTWFQKKFYKQVKNVDFIHRQLVQKEILIPGAFDWDLEDCKSKLIPNSERVAICEELLLGRLRSGGVKHFLTKEIANRVKLLFPDGKVVIFIRSQTDALASSYHQYIKAGGNYSISKFLFPEQISAGDYNPLVLLGLDYFNYLPVLDYYADIFGKENLHIFLYEDFKTSPKSFIDNYCQKLNLDVDTAKLDFSLINDGYRRIIVPFRRFFNSFTRTGPLHKYYIIHIPFITLFNIFVFYRLNKYLRFLPKAKSKKVLGVRNYKKACSFYRESNNILMEKYNLPAMKKYNYPL